MSSSASLAVPLHQVEAASNLLTDHSTQEDGDHMHKAAKQVRAASLAELLAATLSKHLLYRGDTQQLLSFVNYMH